MTFLCLKTGWEVSGGNLLGLREQWGHGFHASLPFPKPASYHPSDPSPTLYRPLNELLHIGCEVLVEEQQVKGPLK